MPNLLSLPRELRDDIYERVLRSSLTLRQVHFPRIRITKRPNASQQNDELAQEHYSGVRPIGGLYMLGTSNNTHLEDPVYYMGEEAIRYPTATPIPPADPLLHVNHQIRAEMNETINKKPVAWRIRLSFRDDKELLYPTWISMPAFTDRIDTLDVEIRIRKKKTASLFSTTSSIASDTSTTSYNRNKNEGDVFFGGFALLQRLLERGPSFVSKKREISTNSNPLSIGCITIHLVSKDLEYRREPKELLDECVGWVDALLTDKDDDSPVRSLDRQEEWKRIDDFLHFFAERIERLAFEIEGGRREWLLKDAIEERDMRAKQREQREYEKNIRELAIEQEEMMGFDRD